MAFSCKNTLKSQIICGDSDWGDEEATVVCRKLGYLRGTGGGELQYCLLMNLRSWLCLIKTKTNQNSKLPLYHAGIQNIFHVIQYLWRIQCTGSEKHLRDCAITTLHSSECQSSDVAIITGCYHCKL